MQLVSEGRKRYMIKGKEQRKGRKYKKWNGDEGCYLPRHWSNKGCVSGNSRFQLSRNYPCGNLAPKLVRKEDWGSGLVPAPPQALTADIKCQYIDTLSADAPCWSTFQYSETTTSPFMNSRSRHSLPFLKLHVCSWAWRKPSNVQNRAGICGCITTKRKSISLLNSLKYADSLHPRGNSLAWKISEIDQVTLELITPLPFSIHNSMGLTLHIFVKCKVKLILSTWKGSCRY